MTSRGTQLARTARRLLEKEVAEAAEVQVECLDLSTLSQEAIVVLPARREGAQMMLLLPVHAGSRVMGRILTGAAGRTAEARKSGTAAARRLLRLVYDAAADVDIGTGARAAPVSYVALRGIEIAIVAAWVPERRREAEERAGLLWYSMAQVRCSLVAAMCRRVLWSRDGWAAPQRDVFSGDRRGAVRPSPTALNDVAAAPPLDHTLAEARAQRDVAALQQELREAAAAEPHIAPQLKQWIECAAVVNEAMQPPESVRECAVRPDAERFLAMPFARRCPIPTTQPMEQRWPPPRWPAHVPRPTSVLDTFMPQHGKQLATHMSEVEAYNTQRVDGGRTRRPEPKSWSDEARYPWLQRKAMRFKGAECELLGAGGPALETRLHKEAMLWLFKEYPHRRLLSLVVHGVRMADGMESEMHTSVAANLDSL